MKRYCSFVAVAVLAALAVPAQALAQTAASNKAFFLAGRDELTVASVSAQSNQSNKMLILNAPNAVKTSTVGGLEVSVSMECALWTFTSVTAESNKGRSSASARAAIKVWVEVNGEMAEPEKVVYCDRYQAIGLDVLTTCELTGVPGGSCTVTDTITLELFQRTKNAASFNFYIAPPDIAGGVHSVKVYAEGIVECTSIGTTAPCPTGVANEFADAKTAAAIGKRTVVIEEHQNWGSGGF